MTRPAHHAGVFAPLELKLLGAGEARLSGERLELPTRKGLALLAYLALEGAATRSRLAGLFWSDNDEESSRRNLRRELHRLRGTGLRDHLEADGDTVGLRAGATTDVGRLHALEASASETELHEVLGVQAELLEGCELDGATGFADWLERERGRVAGSRRRLALALAERLETRGEWRAALALHLRLLNEDSLQERQHREVMRLHYLLGEREAALEQFRRCRESLHVELGLEPLPETLLLAERIRQALALERVEAVAGASGVNLNAPLVGREAERAILENRAGATLLIGEPGVGKTRLAHEFASSHAGWLTLRFGEASRQTPLTSIAEALRANLSHPALGGLEPVWRYEIARLVPEFEPDVAVQTAPAEGRVRFLEGLTRALFALAEVIVLDDLHWADGASLELLAHLAARAATQGVRLIATARAQELRDNPQALETVAALERDGHLARLELRPLAPEDVLSLVRAMSVSAGGQLFAQRLSRTTSGNPFYILETLRHLFETGDLQLDANGDWRTPFDETTSDYAELSVPPSVTRAILERVERLGAASLRLLQTAALAGSEFSFDDVRPATALSEWESVDGLERAVAASALERVGTRYRFAHDLVRGALEANLGLERRALIHAKLAESLRTRSGEPARIAVHLESAGHPREAVSWWVAAAEDAERVFAYQEALAHLDRAVLDSDDPRITFGVRQKILKLVNNFVHDGERWTLELDALDGIASSLGDPSLKVEAALERIRYAAWHSRDAQALEIARWVSAQPGLTTTQTAWALEYTGYALANLGNLDESDAARSDALAVLGDAQSALRGRVMYGLMMNAYKRGRYGEARDWAARCREEYQTVGATAHLINVCTMEGVFAAIAGDTLAGISSLETARDEAERIGHPTYQFAALANLFELHFQQGDIVRAQAALDQMAQVRPVFIEPFEEAAFTRYQSQALWFAGDLGAALERAMHAVEHDERSGVMEHRLLGRLVAAGLHVHLRDTESAKSLLESVGALMNDSSIGFYRVDFELKTAQLQMLTCQAEAALERLQALDASGAQAAEVTRRDILRAKALLQLEQPRAALEVIRSAPASQELEDTASILALQIALEADSSDARDAARALLDSARLPALSALELRAALEDHAALEAQVRALHATLEGYPVAQRGLLERFGMLELSN
jgi:DNA-binding SARP family transcriptional activator